MTVTVQFRIHSPRWGTEDAYEVKFNRDELVVKSPARTATCTWRENLDPVWSGEDLLKVFEADNVYPPAVLPGMIEYAWSAWRGSELKDTELESEMYLVADWVNEVTKAKPESDFWNRYF